MFYIYYAPCCTFIHHMKMQTLVIIKRLKIMNTTELSSLKIRNNKNIFMRQKNFEYVSLLTENMLKETEKNTINMILYHSLIIFICSGNCCPLYLSCTYHHSLNVVACKCYLVANERTNDLLLLYQG